MQKVAALIIGLLALAGCQARAGDDRKDDEAIYAAVKNVMCAANSQDRSASLSTLAAEMERYQPNSDNDSASGAVDVGLQGYEDEGCPADKEATPGAKR